MRRARTATCCRPTGALAFHTASRIDVPPVIDIVDLPAHRSLRTLTDTTALVADAGADRRHADRVPDRRHRCRRVARRLDDQAVELRPVEALSGDRLRLRRAGGADRRRSLGRRRTCSTARWRMPGYLVVSFDNRGTPAPKGAAWRKVIYGAVGELSAKEQAAAVRAFAATRPYVDLDARRHLGLERRRIEHAERDVPVSGHLPRRRVGGAGAGPAPVRHDLPGALHGHARGQRRGLPGRVADQLCRATARAAADRPRLGRRQRALPGHRAAREPAGRTRQAAST